MKHYDWIVIGAGITGAALAYELACKGWSVLLLDQHIPLAGATRFSYGGLSFWSSKTPMTQQFCREGLERYATLSEELECDIEYRQGQLLLPILTGEDPQQVAQTFADVMIPPQLISPQEACQIEPLLNPEPCVAALIVPYGHMRPELTAWAFSQALIRRGGEVQTDQVTEFLWQDQRIAGVRCFSTEYGADQVVVCAGGLSRSLLKAAGIPIRLYFSHAEMVEMPPIDLRLQAFVMVAPLRRFGMESEASTAALDPLWDIPGHEPKHAILDPGVLQFRDGSLRMGQLSRVLTDPTAHGNATSSEAVMRAELHRILPALADCPGTWHESLVAFSCDQLPLVGAIPGWQGLSIFSGFSNPLAILPSLARRFAQYVAGSEDDMIPQLSPGRWGQLG